ncbi:MAG: hypothetical protein WBP81_16130 [Solirubrobacteraceae bacterium]
MVLARLCLLFAAAAVGAQLAALRAAGLKGVAPAKAHGFSVLTATLTDNWVWIIITGLGLILTILAGLMIGGSRQAPDWLFKVIGGILVLLVGIPAVLA